MAFGPGHPKRRTQAVTPAYPKRFPDVDIHDRIPRVFGAHGWQGGCMFCDMFHIVSRSAFDIYAGVSDAYRDCNRNVKLDKIGASCYCHDKKKADKVTDGKTLECFWMRWLWQNNIKIHLNGGGNVKPNHDDWTRGCAFDLFLGTAGVTSKLLRNIRSTKLDAKKFTRVVLAERICCR